MRHRCSPLAFLAVAFLAAPAAFGGVPDFVTYSGRLTDGTAWGQSQTVALTFRIYDKADGGAMLHEQVFGNAAVEDGYFSVMLTGVAKVFGAHDATWITVCVGQGCLPADDLMPRQQVGSVPYALRSGLSEDSDAVGGTTDLLMRKYIALAAASAACKVSFGGQGTVEVLEGSTGQASCSTKCLAMFAVNIFQHALMTGGTPNCSEVAGYSPEINQGYFRGIFACCW